MRLAEEVVEILGEDACIDGGIVRGVFDLEKKNDFGEHLMNPRASFYILATEKKSLKKGFNTKKSNTKLSVLANNRKGSKD